jgi:hypothetical protein
MLRLVLRRHPLDLLALRHLSAAQREQGGGRWEKYHPRPIFIFIFILENKKKEGEASTKRWGRRAYLGKIQGGMLEEEGGAQGGGLKRILAALPEELK